MEDFINGLLEINGVLITLGIGGIIGGLGMIVKAVGKIFDNFNMLKNSIMALQHNEIYKECDRLLKQGYVTIEDLNNLEHLWDGYHGLGGNGTGETLYKRILALPIKEKGEEE